MKEIDGIEFVSRILCEDVRQENNNKFIIIGVFSGDIVLSAIPAQVQLSFYLDLSIKEKGTRTLQFRLSGPGERSQTMGLELVAQKPETTATIVSPGLIISMDQEGTFCLDVSENGEDWFPVIRKNVSLMPD